ncbi:MAG: hypothetical protein AB7G21_00685 [Dehalococcoidia bacterium]
MAVAGVAADWKSGFGNSGVAVASAVVVALGVAVAFAVGVARGALASRVQPRSSAATRSSGARCTCRIGVMVRRGGYGPVTMALGAKRR